LLAWFIAEFVRRLGRSSAIVEEMRIDALDLDGWFR
jgi:hypothetical protein